MACSKDETGDNLKALADVEDNLASLDEIDQALDAIRERGTLTKPEDIAEARRLRAAIKRIRQREMERRRRLAERQRKD